MHCFATLEETESEHRENIRHMHEHFINGYSLKYHNDKIFKNSRELIRQSNNDVSLRHWSIRTTSHNNQYVSGYLANGCYWCTSNIRKVSVKFDEYNLDHFCVKTQHTTYRLSFTESAFTTSYFNIPNSFGLKYNEDELTNEHIYITNWEILDRGDDYKYKYFIRGKSMNSRLYNPEVTSSELIGVSITYDNEDYAYPTLLFVSSDGFAYTVYPNESKYLNEYFKI